MMLSEDNFNQPTKFIPERWLREEKENFNPWVYFPFGFGPRSCIGRRLANLELEIFLIKVKSKYISGTIL